MSEHIASLKSKKIHQKLTFRAIGLALSSTLFLSPSNSFAGEDLDRLLNRVDDLWRGLSSEAVMSMKVKTAHYTRTLKMKAWSGGKDYSLVRILSPRKEKGSATLKAVKNIYTYLPKTDRTIRLTSGMMMGSWMGSHFTNDDLVKESRFLTDYNAKTTFKGKREGKEVIEIEMIPKPDAAVVWGKLVLLVDQKTELPIYLKFFDEDMKPARTMSYSEVKDFGKRRIPAKLRIIPEDKPEEYTEVFYESLKFDIGLKPSFFSLKQLRKRR